LLHFKAAVFFLVVSVVVMLLQTPRVYDLWILGQNLMPEVSIVKVRPEFAAEPDGQRETSESGTFTGVLSRDRSTL